MKSENQVNNAENTVSKVLSFLGKSAKVVGGPTNLSKAGAAVAGYGVASGDLVCIAGGLALRFGHVFAEFIEGWTIAEYITEAEIVALAEKNPGASQAEMRTIVRGVVAKRKAEKQAQENHVGPRGKSEQTPNKPASACLSKAMYERVCQAKLNAEAGEPQEDDALFLEMAAQYGM